MGDRVPPDQGQPPAGGVSPHGGCLALAGSGLHVDRPDRGQQHRQDAVEALVGPPVYH